MPAITGSCFFLWRRRRARHAKPYTMQAGQKTLGNCACLSGNQSLSWHLVRQGGSRH